MNIDLQIYIYVTHLSIYAYLYKLNPYLLYKLYF